MTTLAQLSAAAIASGPGIVIVQGNIVGAAKVQVGSDKTIVGKSGSCKIDTIAMMHLSIDANRMSYSAGRHWPYHPRTEERHCPEHEDQQGRG